MSTKGKKSAPAPLNRQSSFTITGQAPTQSLPLSARSKQTKTSRKRPHQTGYDNAYEENRTPAKASKSQEKKDAVPASKEKEYSKEAEEKFDRMLEGDLNDLPNLPRSMVRIFISSTFSDMRAERNTLAHQVFPKLKEFCALANLDFQVVDMRWGVTEDSQNDHSVEKICLAEVQNCHKVSIGPSFVAIMGDRYGFRPIPTELDRDYFELLRDIAAENKLGDVKLLDTWYKLDENAIPPMYTLQPIRSQFTFYGDHSPGCEGPRQKDTENWQRTFESLQTILRGAATLGFQKKKVSEAQLHDLHLSVTELEIREGILDLKNPIYNCLVFHRELHGVRHLDDKLVQRHMDCINNKGMMEVAEEAKKLKEELTNRVKKKMGDSAIREYKVTWRDGGIDPKSHKDHEIYIAQFCRDMFDGVVDLTRAAIDRQQKLIRQRDYYSGYQEILHHLHFCEAKCETFCGREDVLADIEKYIHDASMRKPLIIHAASGGGKTSVMAMAMKKLKSWYKNKRYIGLIRFLGTSPHSSNIHDVLFSILGQLADQAETIMEPVGYKNMKNLIEYAPRFLRKMSNSLKRPIVIMLDSLDQLSKSNEAYTMSWLPISLPPNVKLIVSTLPEEHGILDNLRELHPEERFYLQLPILPQQTGREIIDSYLAKKKRKVTTLQQRLIMKNFEKAPGPLFLKLILDEAAKWTSYMPEHELVLQDSVKGVINMLFDKLETKFGEVVTSHMLGYITVALNGISENELEDVLSCDDEALNDLYRYHDPPVEGIVRCPPVIVARIQYDIKEYVVERVSHTKHTMNWYHRQFIETARVRYASGVNGEKLHRNLCEIFMAESGVKRSISLARRKRDIPDADRQVTPQPITSMNQRMLMCLPYHIIHSGQQLPEKLAKENCFCNLKYLCAVLQSNPVDTLVDFLSDYLEKNEDEEIQKLRNFFAVSRSDLSRPAKLAVNIIARIDPEEDNIYLKSLIDQAENFLISEKKPVLIPVYPCLAPRRDTSAALLDTFEDIVQVLSDCTEGALVRLKAEETGGETQHGHSVYDFSSKLLSQISLPEITNQDLFPKLDKTGKTVVYVHEDSLYMLSVEHQKVHSKPLKELTPSVSGQRVMYMNFNTDTVYLVLLFESSLLMLVEPSGLQKVDQWTLKENPEDICGILCTSADKLQIIVASNALNGITQTECGKWQFLALNKQSEQFHLAEETISKRQVGMAHSERLYFSGSNRDDGSVITTWNLADQTEVSKIMLPSKICEMSPSKSKPLAGVVMANGEVCMADLNNGVIIYQFQVNDSAFELGISWLHHLVMIGDTQGQINLFDTRTGQDKGSFPAHAKPVSMLHALDDFVISQGKNEDVKIWSVPEIIEDIKETEYTCKKCEKTEGLFIEKHICCFDIHPNGIDLVTASNNGMLRVWDIATVKFKNEITLNIVPNKIQVTSGGIAVVLDKDKKQILAVNIEKMTILSAEFPKYVLDFVLNSGHTSIFLVSQKDKTQTVTEIDLTHLKVKKTFALKPSLKHVTMDIQLSANERYLVIRSMLTKACYNQVAESWKKQGSFLPQPHPYQFTAVDLQQANGGLVFCYRRLVKIPVLGEAVCATSGNEMAITTRRWVVFWDIPTGKCDQRVSKRKKVGMMYRPDWMETEGTSKAIVQSPDGSVLITGSEDGYVFVWDSESGIPLGEQVPKTKHSSPVKALAISPDSGWLLSACRNNILKLWDVSSATEVFSMQINGEVQDMKFSSDSKHVVIRTGTKITRMLVFRLYMADKAKNPQVVVDGKAFNEV